MKSKFVLMSIALLTILAGYFISCQKEEKPSDTEMGFTFSVNTSVLKSASVNLGDARKIVLTIKNADGTPTRYTSYKVDIFSMYGSFYSDNLFLKTGSYKLTLFTLIDSSGNTIYAAPLTGSPEAAYVSKPLPIFFTIQANVVNSVNVQVLSTYGKKPDDFGLVQFPFTEVKVLKIMVGVFSQDSNRFVSAKLEIRPNNQEIMLKPIANNIIVVKDNFSNYEIIIGKGDVWLLHTFTKDSLKMYSPSYGNVPLKINLPRKCSDLSEVVDNEGNHYPVTQIGNKIWMAKNLETKHYNNGDTIEKMPLNPFWDDSVELPKYYHVEEVLQFYSTYYTWYAITDNRGVCPSGMHIPSDSEWKELITTVGGYYSGENLQAADYTWSNGLGASSHLTNNYCFSARPGGIIEDDTKNSEKWFQANFWSSKSLSVGSAWGMQLYINGHISQRSDPKYFMSSVRCVKNADN